MKTAATALALIVCLVTAPLSHAQDAKSAAVKKQLKATVLPALVFDEANLDEAVAYLQMKFKEANPKAEPLNIVKLGKETSLLNLRLHQLSFHGVISEICDQAGFTWSVGGHGIIKLTPRKEAPKKAAAPNAKQTATKTWLSRTVLPKIHFDEANVVEATDYYRQKAIEHAPKGGPKAVNIIVRQDLLKDDAKAQLITLKLVNIPLDAALDLTTELAGVQWHISEHGSVVISAKE